MMAALPISPTNLGLDDYRKDIINWYINEINDLLKAARVKDQYSRDFTISVNDQHCTSKAEIELVARRYQGVGWDVSYSKIDSRAGKTFVFHFKAAIDPKHLMCQ